MVLSKRLPGIAARDVCPSVRLGDCSSAYRADRPKHTLRHSREPPVNQVRGHATRRDKYRGFFLARSKAAHLQVT